MLVRGNDFIEASGLVIAKIFYQMSGNDGTCYIYQKYRYEDGKNNTIKIKLAGGYEGIPEVFVLNVAVYAVRKYCLRNCKSLMNV